MNYTTNIFFFTWHYYHHWILATLLVIVEYTVFYHKQIHSILTNSSNSVVVQFVGVVLGAFLAFGLNYFYQHYQERSAFETIKASIAGELKNTRFLLGEDFPEATKHKPAISTERFKALTSNPIYAKYTSSQLEQKLWTAYNDLRLFNKAHDEIKKSVSDAIDELEQR